MFLVTRLASYFAAQSIVKLYGSFLDSTTPLFTTHHHGLNESANVNVQGEIKFRLDEEFEYFMWEAQATALLPLNPLHSNHVNI